MPSSVPLLPDERLVALEPVMALLTDAADAFDADSLQFDSECQVHGLHPEPQAECICEGARTTALEFIVALGVDVRSAVRGAPSNVRPAGQPNRKRDGETRVALAVAG